jgi:hypothetical protein
VKDEGMQRALELARRLRSLLDGFEPEFRLIADMKQSEMVLAIEALLHRSEQLARMAKVVEAIQRIRAIPAPSLGDSPAKVRHARYLMLVDEVFPLVDALASTRSQGGES